MGDKNDGLVRFFEVFEIAFTFLLESSVADGEYFVEEQNVATSANGNRKGEADLHTGRIVFEFLVLEIFEFGKVPNVVVHLIHFGVAKAKQSAIHVDVFAAGELWIKTNAKFDERNQGAIDDYIAFFWVVDAGENFEKGRFAGAVAPDDAEKFTFFDFKIETF